MAARLVALPALALLFVLLSFSNAFAYPPNLDWRTIETEHFRITYHQGLRPMAQRLARMSENVYDELTVLLEHTPTWKTELLLVDHVDSPNGLTNVYPYNKIALYAVPPGRRMVLNDYDDWFRVLFAHEMTHIIQLDTKSGLPFIINHIFGGIIHPNQYMPRWYTEGSAVLEETNFSSGGRLRSSYIEMVVRMDTMAGKLPELDQINESSYRWPHGHIPYIYGAKFVSYMSDKYGDKTLAAFAYLYGQRVIPYALNTILQKVVDDDFVRLYDEWRIQIEARYKEEIRRLEKLGLSDMRLLTELGEDHDSPKLFPTGDRMLYFHDDAVPQRRGWAILDLDTLENEIVIECDSDGGATISPDGRHIVYGQIGYGDPFLSHHDLYTHDLDRNETKALTRKLRAREPSFSPDGKHIAFVQYTPGESRLMILDSDSGDLREPFPASQFSQVFAPAWSPDGRYIAFSGWRIGQFKDLYLFDTEDNRLLRISDDRSIDQSPSWSSDGSTLYWSSDRSGIYNIYAYDMAGGITSQLTNVIGGAFSPAVTADGKRLFFSAYTEPGFQMAWMNLENQPGIPAPQVPELRPYNAVEEPEVPFSDKDYSPFPSLYPKIWRPSMGEDYEGTTLGFSTWGDDIAGVHSWRAEVDVGIQSGDPTIGLSYRNSAYIPHFSMNAAHVSYTLKDVATDGDQKIDQSESRTNGSFSISFPFTGRDVHAGRSFIYNHRISLSTSFNYTRLLNKRQYEPTTIPPQYAETGLGTGLSLTWSYQNREMGAGAVGSARGRSLFVSVRTTTDLLGGDSNSISAVGGYSEFIPNPWIDQHTLALKFSGGIGASEYQTRQMFYLGGPPERDIVDDIIRDNRVYGDFIRGYDPFSFGGNKYFLAKSEYRFVIWNIERGISTLPWYFRRLHLAPFFDAGYLWNDEFEPSDFLYGTGGEIRLDMIMGYQRLMTLRIGYQIGFNHELATRSLFFALDNMF